MAPRWREENDDAPRFSKQGPRPKTSIGFVIFIISLFLIAFTAFVVTNDYVSQGEITKTVIKYFAPNEQVVADNVPMEPDAQGGNVVFQQSESEKPAISEAESTVSATEPTTVTTPVAPVPNASEQAQTSADWVIPTNVAPSAKIAEPDPVKTEVVPPAAIIAAPAEIAKPPVQEAVKDVPAPVVEKIQDSIAPKPAQNAAEIALQETKGLAGPAAEPIPEPAIVAEAPAVSNTVVTSKALVTIEEPIAKEKPVAVEEPVAKVEAPAPTVEAPAPTVEAPVPSDAPAAPADIVAELPTTPAAPPKAQIVNKTQGEIMRDCETCPELAVVSPGHFMMGQGANTDGAEGNAAPLRDVAINQAFALGVHEITFDDWDRCVADGGCSSKPSDDGWGRGQRPVILVSFDEITTQYLPWLSRVSGQTYRLPTEAEWEYAARGGAIAPAAQVYAAGSDERTLCEYGNGADGGACDDSFATTAPVGSFKPNSLGLYDMQGNVWEWVSDCWQAVYSLNKVSTASECKSRVLRGGSWSSGAGVLLSSVNGWEKSDKVKNSIGFRVARSIP